MSKSNDDPLPDIAAPGVAREPGLRLPTEGSASLALIALLAGAIAMGISPVFVRLAEVGSYSSAFWRVFVALPLLWVWSRLERRPDAANWGGLGAGWSWPVVIAGLLFAGDLIFWHLSIMKTSIANATFLATLAPVWVLLGSNLILREAPSRNMWFGLLACLAGAVFLVGSNFGVAPERFVGDVFGLITSLFFGSYILATRFVRRSLGPGGMMFRSSIITSICLLLTAMALGDTMLPQTWRGWLALAGLALLAHAAGQGLLAFALGRLTAGFSALVIFLEALTAAAFAWIALGEALTILQIAGGILILSGIWFARPGRLSSSSK